MKNIKDITLSAFAVIGFYTIITAFTSTESNPAQQVVNGTPESHVWEVYTREGTTAWLLNKKSGEIIGMDASSRKKFKPVWRK
tara:strand:+ start:107 stop:355 length:249 start_codon:yes stop_codon:yes gene_type:complete